MRVSAAGDVAALVSNPAPQSGVYAVRAGPVLFENLMAGLGGDTPRAVFRPQRRVLALLALDDRHAMRSHGSLALSGRWVWRWKARIDRRSVQRYS
jgi:selenide,water dikinase